ncbi:MAG: hypothetical protein KBS89_04070 [Bacteroidales bacterium]|nr:hypothetical protein [Candidatus Egerieousia equi]
MRKHLTINALPAVLLCLCILCSCDGLKHMLGMKTSSEIEQMKQMDYEISQRQKMLQDSLAAVEAAERAVAENPGLDKRYYVILGSFKEQSNVDLMVRDAKAFNFNPIVIPCSNGFTMVAASGHSTLPEACSARIKVEELDICPYDIWIYDTNQGLHK